MRISGRRYHVSVTIREKWESDVEMERLGDIWWQCVRLPEIRGWIS